MSEWDNKAVEFEEEACTHSMMELKVVDIEGVVIELGKQDNWEAAEIVRREEKGHYSVVGTGFGTVQGGDFLGN